MAKDSFSDLTQEFTALKQLSEKGLNVDKSFAVIFKERAHLTDSRPMAYKGRICHNQTIKEKSFFWSKSRLCLDTVTTASPQLHTKDMETVENLGETALPTMCDDAAATVQGGKKFQQIGADANLQILRGLLEGVDIEKTSGVLSPQV